MRFIDVVKFLIAFFTYKFHSVKLLSVFNNFFSPVNEIQGYNIR